MLSWVLSHVYCQRMWMWINKFSCLNVVYLQIRNAININILKLTNIPILKLSFYSRNQLFVLLIRNKIIYSSKNGGSLSTQEVYTIETSKKYGLNNTKIKQIKNICKRKQACCSLSFHQGTFHSDSKTSVLSPQNIQHSAPSKVIHRDLSFNFVE